ncbi:helix-turn-helix transcriptional regulator [Nocardia yamanashiensis]|uniref:helix-turn-helix domain-containing protein n=1 Tax=Nocardia yamanashiensis TaxID=209247 RepID=UPI001E65B6EE|nr:helix-turn-helix transcriptional regulator [Nocardia yamanashiensis]UGT43735.1 helix-turn-helix transcriptional regulator [Nocardia yamanashiensis]
MSELGDFLKAKRAALTPEQAGLPAVGNPRRVKGLRREEVALLAAVSVDHYTRLEQGRVAAASENLLAGIARALRLSDEEHEYLRMLVGARPPRRKSAEPRVGGPLRDLLDVLPTPALVLGPRTDIIGWNASATALFLDFVEIPVQQRALVRMVFLEPRMRGLFLDWEQVAAEAVDRLRMAAARTPGDPRLAQLVGELSVHDADFRRWWAGHGVRAMAGGRKRLRHPVVGELELDWQVLQVLSASEQTLVTYTAAAGSPSAQALRILDSWSAPAHPGAVDADH